LSRVIAHYRSEPLMRSSNRETDRKIERLREVILKSSGNEFQADGPVYRQTTVFSISGMSDARKVKMAPRPAEHRWRHQIIEVQRLVGTALTDNQVSFRVHTCRQWDTCGILSDLDVQPVKDVAPRSNKQGRLELTERGPDLMLLLLADILEYSLW